MNKNPLNKGILTEKAIGIGTKANGDSYDGIGFKTQV